MRGKNVLQIMQKVISYENALPITLYWTARVLSKHGEHPRFGEKVAGIWEYDGGLGGVPRAG